MRFYRFLSQVPENAVFWLLLFSLVLGSASSLYGKITDKAALKQAAVQYYTAAPAANSQAVISIKNYIPSGLPYPCQIYRVPELLR